MDRMTIVGQDGQPSLLIEGDQIIDLKTHTHRPILIDGQLICELCSQPIEGDFNGNQS